MNKNSKYIKGENFELKESGPGIKSLIVDFGNNKFLDHEDAIKLKNDIMFALENEDNEEFLTSDPNLLVNVKDDNPIASSIVTDLFRNKFTHLAIFSKRLQCFVVSTASENHTMSVGTCVDSNFQMTKPKLVF